MPLPNLSSRAEFTFSFLSFKLSARGIVAFVLAFPMAMVLLALTCRIAAGDLSIIHTAVASYGSGAKNPIQTIRE